jgi:hypothetical protein
MGILTRKFSQFIAGNNSASNQLVGLSAGANAIFNDPITWTTATRPVTPTNGLLGYNTDLDQYEYYNAGLAVWVQLNNSQNELAWNNVTGTIATMMQNNGYVANNIGTVNLTMPAVCAFGQRVRICGYGAGGWIINFNAGQNAIVGIRVVTTTTGLISSSLPSDQIELLCVVANTTFVSLTSYGNLLIS